MYISGNLGGHRTEENALYLNLKGEYLPLFFVLEKCPSIPWRGNPHLQACSILETFDESSIAEIRNRWLAMHNNNSQGIVYNSRFNGVYQGSGSKFNIDNYQGYITCIKKRHVELAILAYYSGFDIPDDILVTFSTKNIRRNWKVIKVDSLKNIFYIPTIPKFKSMEELNGYIAEVKNIAFEGID